MYKINRNTVGTSTNRMLATKPKSLTCIARKSLGFGVNNFRISLSTVLEPRREPHPHSPLLHQSGFVTTLTGPFTMFDKPVIVRLFLQFLVFYFCARRKIFQASTTTMQVPH